MGEEKSCFYEFGPFRLVPEERQLLREGQRVSLPPKAFDTLLILVERKGRIVRKDEIINAVWPDTFIEENNLNQYVSLLRKALGDGQNGDHYIETVRRYGYRFTADVREADGEEGVLLLQHKRTQTQVVIREEVSEESKYSRTEGDAPSAAGQDVPLSRGRRLVYGLMGCAALVGLAAIFFFKDSSERKAVEAAPGIRSIAVLPFKPIGVESSGDEYLGLGFADALITKLGQLREISVRPTQAIQKYDADARDPAQIGRELKVDVVLDGRFQKSGDQIRITAQLVNVRDRTLLWTGQFDERASDLFAVQDSISEQAAKAMKLQLSAWEHERLAKPATANPEAYQAYLKGRYFWNKRTIEGLNKGIENFRRAIDLDPNYASAYAGLADCYNLLSEYNGSEPIESFAAAKQVAQKALEIDESLGEAHASLAYVLVNHEWDWASGEREFKRAIELRPSYATAHQWYAEYLLEMGRLDEAQAEFARALELDPLSLIINAEQGLVFLVPGKYEQAIERFRKALDLDPNFPVTHSYLRVAYVLSGRDEQALAERLIEIRLAGWSPEEINAMKRAYECCGLRGVWKCDLALAKDRQKTSYFSPYMLAQIYARLGEKEQTLNYLEQAYKEHDRYMIGLRQDPFFAGLRPDPRFQDLLRRMNFLEVPFSNPDN